MKILVYSNSKDFKFLSLTKCLSALDVELGLVEGTISKDDITRFNPDILIHNLNSRIKSNGDSFAEIKIDDEVYKKIGPFTSYLSDFITKDNDVFACDMSYIGSPDDFGLELYKYFNKEYDLKLFFERPLPVFSYCGVLDKTNVFNVYNRSKISLVPENDNGFRELDIIASGGKPIKFVNKKQFHEEVKESLKNGVKMDASLRKKVLNEKTAFDKMSDILRKEGMGMLGKKLRSSKKKYIND